MHENQDEIVLDIFYDLKVLVTKTKNKTTGYIQMKAYEKISDYNKEIVNVLDWRGGPIGDKDVKFDVVVPRSEF